MIRTIAASILCLALLVTFASHAEERKDGREVDVPRSKLPEKVARAATDAVPGGKIADIDRDIKNGKSTWQVGVDAGGKEYEVDIDDDGKVLSKVEVVSEKLKLTDVPAAVKDGVKKEFADGKITAAQKLTKGTEVTYELDVDSKKKTYEVVFSPEGKLVSKAEAAGEGDEEKPKK